MSATAPFPDLPVDIAREILQVAAFSEKQTACRLAVVSRTVRQWIDPILYHTVELHDHAQRQLFIESVKHRINRDPTFCATHVKRLYAKNCMPLTDTNFILTHCSGITSFNVPAGLHPNTSMQALSHLRRLCLSFTWDEHQNDALVSSLPHSITHLNIRYFGLLSSVSWPEVFQRCPEIIHLHIDCNADNYVHDWSFLEKDDEIVSIVNSILSVAPTTLATVVFEPWVSGRCNDRLQCAGPFERYTETVLKRISDERFAMVCPTMQYGGVSGRVCEDFDEKIESTLPVGNVWPWEAAHQSLYLDRQRRLLERNVARRNLT